jgi:thiamine transport system substrate-binding protein
MKNILRPMVVLALLTAVASCGSSNSASPAPAAITLIAYDSFPTKDSALNAALDEFSQSTGIKVTIATAGDTGTMFTKAKLTAGNPEGDVMWGVDSTQVAEAVADHVFDPYDPNGSNAIATNLTALVPGHELTPVDYGDICLNFDKAWFGSHHLDPPKGFDELIDPKYNDLLVVEDATKSGPGLGFLLATIAKFGDGWQDYWKALRSNGVKVVGDWDAAYYTEFSGAAGSTGTRPIVVSYGSSPPAEVIFADPPRTDAPTGVVESTCFREVEFAGVLRGTKHRSEARKLVDFLITQRFQSTMPLTLFVYPARTGVDLPPEFTKYSVVPRTTLSIDAAKIAANRQKWQDEWTDIVLR